MAKVVLAGRHSPTNCVRCWCVYLNCSASVTKICHLCATHLIKHVFDVECRLSDLVGCKAVVAFQGVDALHLVGSQFEVEDVVILGDVRGIAGARNGDGKAGRHY